MKKVTQILCYYNEEKYIAKSIESLLNQTYTNLEIIAISDASTDTSPQIVEEYAKRDNRIITVNNSENHGLAWVRNQGLDMATGDYVGFVDGDDISMPDRVQSLVDFLDQNEEYFLVSNGYDTIDEEGNKTGEYVHRYGTDEHIKAAFLFNNPLMGPSTLFRRDIVEENHIRNNVEHRTGQDYYFWIKCMNLGKFCILNKPLLKYRVHSSKANQYNKNNKQLVDKRMKIMVLECWEKMGIQLSDEEIDLVYYILRHNMRAKKLKDIVLGRNLYKKVAKVENNEYIRKEYIERYNNSVRYMFPLYLR